MSDTKLNTEKVPLFITIDKSIIRVDKINTIQIKYSKLYVYLSYRINPLIFIFDVDEDPNKTFEELNSILNSKIL